jgi:hypothetical protein
MCCNISLPLIMHQYIGATNLLAPMYWCCKHKKIRKISTYLRQLGATNIEPPIHRCIGATNSMRQIADCAVPNRIGLQNLRISTTKDRDQDLKFAALSGFYIFISQFIRARICKCLTNLGIDSKASITLAYVAWRVGTSIRVVVLARQAGNRFLGSFKGLQIRALELVPIVQAMPSRQTVI